MISSLMVASYLTEKEGASPEIEGYRSIDNAWLPLFEMSYEENENHESKSFQTSTFTKSSNEAEHPLFAQNAQFHLRTVKEVNGQVKYFFVDNESDTSQIKLVCQPCVKSATCTFDAGEPPGEQDENKIRPWVEKVPTISEREWKFLNSSEILENHCVLCNVKLSKVYRSQTENSPTNVKNIRRDATDPIRPPANLLQFSEYKHSAQFFRLIKKIKYQINYFSVENDPQNKKFSLICTLCNKSMDRVSTAVWHVRQKEHLLRFAKNCANLVMVPMITDDYWKFLMPRRDSEDFMCYLCHVRLSTSPFSWSEHFQSESHVVLKSQQLQNDASDSDTSLKCASAESIENSLSNTNKGELHRLESSSHSCIISTSSDILRLENSPKTAASSGSDTITSNFKFTRYSHCCQFLRIVKKINDQVNWFSFESRPASKKLKVTCVLCSKSIGSQGVRTSKFGSVVTAAALHVKEEEHLLNLSEKKSSLISANLIPTLSEENWNFIVTEAHTESFTCTLCNLNLRKSSFKGPSTLASVCINAWVNHLQSESHLLKLHGRDFDKENLCHHSLNDKSSTQNTQNEYLGVKQNFCKGKARKQQKADDSSSSNDSFSRNKIKDSRDFRNPEDSLSSNKEDYSPAQGTNDESIFYSSDSERSKNYEISSDKNLNRVSIPSSLCSESSSTVTLYSNSYELEETPDRKSFSETSPTEQLACHLELRSQTSTRGCSANDNTLEVPVTSTEDTSNQEVSKLVETPNNKSIEDESSKKNFSEAPPSLEPEPLPDLFQDLFDLEFEQNSSQEQQGDESILEIPIPENLFQDAFDFDSFKFCPKSQRERFENLTKELNYQINYFSFDRRTSSQKMICKLCNKYLYASEVEAHANDQEHLENLFTKAASAVPAGVSNLSDENWQFLDFIPSSQEYLCILCSVKLPNNNDSWAAHFCSETHMKLAESQTMKNLEEYTTEHSNSPKNSKQICEKSAEENIHLMSKSEAFNKDQKERKSSFSESNLKDHSFKSVNESRKSVRSYTAEKNDTGMTTKSEVLINRSDRKSTGESSKFKSTESKSNLSENSDCKAVGETGKIARNYAQSVSSSNSPKKITDLESVFKFVRIDSYFPTFSYLNRGEQICLRRNCKFILVDVDSKEVFCTACHYFFFVKSEDEKTSLRNLTFHFTSLHHKKEAHRYGPAAYFQKNIASMTFFENNTGFCRVCRSSLPNCVPQDIDVLLGHFESTEHGDLMRAACNYNDPTYSTKVNNDLVTLFISKKKYDSRVVYTSKTSSQKSE